MAFTSIFVYGTLQQGMFNHFHLEPSSAEGEAVFQGKAKTLDAFPLVMDEDFGIPFLLPPAENEGSRIFGEVYKVDPTVLAALDKLEGYPTYYDRKEVQVELLATEKGEPLASPRTLTCFVYVRNLETSPLQGWDLMPTFDHYSLELHKKYVPRHLRGGRRPKGCLTAEYERRASAETPGLQSQ